jgi:hypothetical protein
MKLLLQRMQRRLAIAPELPYKPQSRGLSGLSRLDLCTFFRCSATIGESSGVRRPRFRISQQAIDFKELVRSAENLGKLRKIRCGRLPSIRKGSFPQTYAQDLWKGPKAPLNPKLRRDFDVSL